MNRLVRDEGGATSIEYALIATLIGMAIVTSLLATGSSVGDLYTTWGTRVVDALASSRTPPP